MGHGYKSGGVQKDKYWIQKRCDDCDGSGQVPARLTDVHGRVTCGRCLGSGWVPADEDARYFVLRYDIDPHALIALATYAESVRRDNPTLASELGVLIAQQHAAKMAKERPK